MAHANSRAVLNALEDLLEGERTQILAGEIEKLSRLLPEKERLLNALKASDEDFPLLERLRDQVDRNQQLLAAAARGIRSVKQRLDALKTSQTELRTYSQAGRPQDLSKQESRFERKA
ncbi:flagellar biosynthesis protein FlgN [Aliiroseovarius sp. S1339]|uniref:flagellar biosynthesis protein FlgN n=1 Tax=Aliiroseovarius sp. S1339 TaxID=2936990 RepID=UPI0020BE8054|nr:flagellar biosynthesis protein FlgN [Aliiroseovarius sp. S1339]MCK8463351.1 flagellar biosynthesis protein FlgN [Aliiroseovarius sp. S1339]